MFVVVISFLAAFLAVTYAPWMASFTETVEKHNPAGGHHRDGYRSRRGRQGVLPHPGHRDLPADRARSST
jgi:hypothetical protein